MEQLTLAEIEWVDAYFSSCRSMTLADWRASVQKTQEIHHVVGYLLYEDEHQVAVAQNVSKDGVDNVFVVPKQMVRMISYPSTTIVVETEHPCLT